MSRYIKLSKAQLSIEIYQVNKNKKVITDFTIPLARDNLTELVSSSASSAINKFERKISGKGVVRAVKVFTLFISNEDMNDIVKIIKSLE